MEKENISKKYFCEGKKNFFGEYLRFSFSKPEFFKINQLIIPRVFTVEAALYHHILFIATLRTMRIGKGQFVHKHC
jgi:hypothetical protein